MLPTFTPCPESLDLTSCSSARMKKMGLIISPCIDPRCMSNLTEYIFSPSNPCTLAVPCAASYIVLKRARVFLDAPASFSAVSMYLWLTLSKAAAKSMYVTTQLVLPFIMLSYITLKRSMLSRHPLCLLNPACQSDINPFVSLISLCNMQMLITLYEWLSRPIAL